MYDYLLVVGPGRSGSEFLYRLLRGHPSFVFPEIKERYYYRSPRAFRRAWQRLDGLGQGQILCDVANLAYADAKLSPGIDALAEEGYRVLLVALLRDHRERAISMMQFRRSRGELSALRGPRNLETAVVRDRLTPDRLTAIFQTNADVLTLSFPALTRDTGAVLEVLAALCGTPRFSGMPQPAVNEAVGARSWWLSALGRWGAYTLRRLGFRRLLQRIKENRTVNRAFFVPLSTDRERPRFAVESVRLLDAAALDCQTILENSARPVSEGIYLRKREQPDDAPRG